MPRSRLVTWLRALAIIGAVWTAVALFSALSAYFRSLSGERALSPDWFWDALPMIPVWTALTPPVLAVSRRFPFERRTWHLAVLGHGFGLAAVLAADGLVNMVLSPNIGTREATYWQQVWRYSFIDGFFYAGIVAVEHAARYYRWYLERRVETLELEAQLSRAQLQALQMQIRPHFLFNTLNTALTLVRLDPGKAEGVLEDLAELFRVAITESTESVSLGEEVDLAQRYLDIEQIRFGSRLHVTWELDAQAASARVPPLLLQPLVENAVRHGVEPSPEGGVIRVRTKVKLGRAVLSIANSVPKEPSRPGHGMALKNVRERLRLMHDVAAQFEMRQDKDVFRVQIVVPL
jgi:hypothetical protein